jgi:murein DD-endopeptidase MepM/ murein hydrolase activator NlpD
MQNQTLGPLARPSAEMLNRSLDQFQSRIRSAEGVSSQQKREELKKVARDFESLFVGYLLKVMRETIEEAGAAEGGLGKDIYTQLFDEEMAKTIARQGTFGIADMLINRLSVEESPSASQPGGSSSGSSRSQSPLPAMPTAPSRDPVLDSGEEISDVQLPIRGRVSSEFGMRRDPFTQQQRFHKGMDLAAPMGTEVRAALEGEVAFAGFKPGYGNTVIIRHAGGVETTYAHLGGTDVRKGDVIASGQILGSVGNTGHSTGSHLHFEVTRRGDPVDPREALAD